MHEQAEHNCYLRKRSTDEGPKAGVSTKIEAVDNGNNPADGLVESKETVNVGFWRSLAINFIAYSLPAVYLILSKLWIAELDPNIVALTDTFNYMGILAEAFNQGLPKAAWRTIADRHGRRVDERYRLANTLILFQSCIALIMLVATCIGATRFVTGFVPAEIQAQSAFYVRVTSASIACSVVNTALSTSARALDHPDVPLLLAVVKTVVNIVLDLLLLSPLRPFRLHPTVNTQAIVRASCDLIATCASLMAFIAKQKRERRRRPQWRAEESKVSLSALKVLAKVGGWYQIEALPRTAVSLYFSSLVVSQGLQWATAYGVFFTIRIGLGFVPLLAVEASCQTYTGHSWGLVSRNESTPSEPDRHEKQLRLKILFRSVAVSTLMICVIEVAMYFCVGFGFGHRLALYLSGSEPVADLTVKIWILIDWGYIFLAMFFQIGSVILIAKPRWYLYQSLVVTILYSLPMTLGFWHASNDDKARMVWFVVVCAGAPTFQFFNNLAWTHHYVRRF